MRALPYAFACLAATAAVACNAIFGIQPGVGTGGGASTGTGGAAPTTSSSTGGAPSTSSSGTGGTGGHGGAPVCPVTKIPPCHVDGGAGAICDAIPISAGFDGYTIGLVVVGDTVYWASGNGKITFASDQGVLGADFGDGNDSVLVATDGSNVYWTDWYDGKIRGGSLAAGHPIFDVSSMTGDAGMTPRGYLGRIVWQGGMLYWAGEDPDAIWTAKADGTQVYATKVADKTDNTESTDVSIGVAVDDAHVYWTDAGKVRRLPLGKLGDATAIEDFATDPGAGEVMVDEARVYWTSTAGVASKKKDGSDLVALPTPGSRARSLLLDGAWMYWSEDGGRIVRAQKGGGMSTVTVIAQGTPEAYMLAADCGAIYWSTFAFDYGHVYKVRKPD